MMGEKAFMGDYVQIHRVILNPGERAPQVPDDTKKVPLEMFVKGFLVDTEAVLGQEVTIRTVIDRKITGKLVAINPQFIHDFARPQPELLTVGQEVRKKIKRGDLNG